MKKIIITIDGHSACGKSTLAKALARELDYGYIDTGAMYRAVTYFFLENRVNIQKTAELERALKKIKITFKSTVMGNRTFLNGQDVEDVIRKMFVAKNVSHVATISAVRKMVVKQQKEMGRNKGIVMEGRDIGTVVFPEAELKIFLTANEDVRTQRRYDELTKKGQKVSLKNIKANLLERDHIDSTRKDSPLKQAKESVLINNTNLTEREQLAMTFSLAKERIRRLAAEEEKKAMSKKAPKTAPTRSSANQKRQEQKSSTPSKPIAKNNPKNPRNIPTRKPQPKKEPTNKSNNISPNRNSPSRTTRKNNSQNSNVEKSSSIQDNSTKHSSTRSNNNRNTSAKKSSQVQSNNLRNTPPTKNKTEQPKKSTKPTTTNKNQKPQPKKQIKPKNTPKNTSSKETQNKPLSTPPNSKKNTPTTKKQTTKSTQQKPKPVKKRNTPKQSTPNKSQSSQPKKQTNQKSIPNKPSTPAAQKKKVDSTNNTKSNSTKSKQKTSKPVSQKKPNQKTTPRKKS